MDYQESFVRNAIISLYDILFLSYLLLKLNGESYGNKTPFELRSKAEID